MSGWVRGCGAKDREQLLIKGKMLLIQHLPTMVLLTNIYCATGVMNIKERRFPPVLKSVQLFFMCDSRCIGLWSEFSPPSQNHCP